MRIRSTINPSTAPGPAFEGGVKKRYSQSRLSWYNQMRTQPKLVVNTFVNVVNYVPQVSVPIVHVNKTSYLVSKALEKLFTRKWKRIPQNGKLVHFSWIIDWGLKGV